MDKYKIIKVVGDGAYGCVYKAVNTSNGQIVAIKKIKRKFSTWDECMNLREIKSLRSLRHPNIVRLQEVLRVNEELHFIFEYLNQNAYQLIKDHKQPLREAKIRDLIFQTLKGLAYMHKHGFFHRDMKPENLMVQDEVLKIADFGLAREIRSKPPFTDYVSTRWYRAPEILLHSTSYNSPVDIFAVGVIMAEFYSMQPLFPGANEHDQIIKICSILGTPKPYEWPEGYCLASKIGFTFPFFEPIPLEKVLPNASSAAIDLILQMLSYNPLKRPTAADCLKHSYFSGIDLIQLSLSADLKQTTSKHNETENQSIRKQMRSHSKKLTLKNDLPKNSLPLHLEHNSRNLGKDKTFNARILHENKKSLILPISLNKINESKHNGSSNEECFYVMNYKRHTECQGYLNCGKPKRKYTIKCLFKPIENLTKKTMNDNLKTQRPSLPPLRGIEGKLPPKRVIPRASIFSQASYAALNNPLKYHRRLNC